MRLYPLCCIGLLACGGTGGSGNVVKSPTSTEASKSAYKTELGQPPAVFENSDGVTLTIISLMGEANQPKQALIQFTGAQHPLAGKVILATAVFESNGRNYTWKVDYQGEPQFIVTVFSRSRDEMKMVTKLYLPMTRTASRMSFSRELTQALDWQELAQIHDQQVADGSLALLAKAPVIDMEKYKREAQAKLEKEVERLQAQCGPIQVEIDWSTVDGISALEATPCYKGLSAVRKVCKRSLRAGEVVRHRAKKIVCESSDKAGYRLDSQGSLHISSNHIVKGGVRVAQVKEIFGLGQIVIRNRSGGVLVFDPEMSRYSMGRAPEYNVYWGDGVTMHKQRINYYKIWGSTSHVAPDVKNGKWVVGCPGDVQEFEELEEKESKKILSTASFGEQVWKRKPVSLSRDQRGQYFYVDRLQDQFGGKDYRVFKGMRGNLQPTQLIDIIDDPSGKVFSTRQGQLRLLLDKDSSLWIAGKKRSPLTEVWRPKRPDDHPRSKVSQLIYHGLGVYDGQAFGTVCD